MSKIVLGNKAKAILSSFAGINDAMRIAQDKLFVRSENSSTLGLYKPAKEDDLTIPNEFSIGSVNQFLSVIGMCNDPEITKDGATISIKDKTKRFTYNDMPLEAISSLSQQGITLYQQSEDKRLAAVLDEVIIKEISNAISKLSLDKVYLVTDSDGNVKVKAVNESTDNSVEYNLEGSGVPSQEFEFGEIDILTNLFDGIYALEVRVIDAGGTEKPLASFVNKSIAPEDGTLIYIVGMN